MTIMAKTKQKLSRCSYSGPVKSDDPIYQTGRILLRPVHGPKPEPAVSAESSDSTDTDQESSESGK